MSTQETPETIELKNLGPIEYVKLTLPKGGGISLFRGPNDCGKSYAIDTVRRLAGGSQKLEPRDGQPGRGEARMGDVVLRVGQSTRTIGEMDVLSIEGRLDITELVEPKIKDPVAADKARTKALCRLTGAKAEPTAFFDGAAGRERFAAVVTAEAVSQPDLVEMQRMIKRDFEVAARKSEDDAKKAEGEALAAASALEGLDLAAQCDSVKLQQGLEEAITAATGLRNRAEAAKESAKAVTEATQASERAKEGYEGLTVEEATEDHREARNTFTEAVREEEQAYKDLASANQRTQAAIGDRNLAEEKLRAAEAHTETIILWQATIDAGKIKGPAEQEIIDADLASQQARLAVEQGALIREGHINATKRDAARKAATDAKREADTLRQCGRDSEAVLGEIVSAEGLTLIDGRWCTEQEGRGRVFFADRSRGTRAAMAIGLVAKTLRATGVGQALVPVPQELWEGLDADNRAKLLQACLDLEVNIVTAECDRDATGALRAETFEG